VPPRVVALTAAALLGFASNSLLCRLALGAGSIDAASFTLVRLLSGALTLAVLARRSRPASHGNWPSALALFGYAVLFSFSYVRIGAAAGALLLFGAVQVTMLGVGLAAGERLSLRSGAGLGLALTGLVALVAPGLSAPEPFGAALMLAAGVAWGVYSLRGRRATEPLLETAGNFARSVPIALLLAAAAAASQHLTPRGVVIAALSGSFASGIGYSLWYAALPSLGAVRAGIVQLTVPALTAAGAALFLGEPVTARLLLASVAILGGVALAILGRR
jgi:drug/metabolite transporter (DMT)-like permease